MTTLKAIQSKAALNYPVEDSVFEIALQEAGLDPEAEYLPSTDQRALELCIADVILVMITSAKSVSDDGFSVTAADVKSLWAARGRWRKKWGLEDDTPGDDSSQPVIADLSKYW